MVDDLLSIQKELQAVLGYPLDTEEACELMLTTHEAITNMMKAYALVTKLIDLIQRLTLKYSTPTSC